MILQQEKVALIAQGTFPPFAVPVCTLIIPVRPCTAFSLSCKERGRRWEKRLRASNVKIPFQTTIYGRKRKWHRHLLDISGLLRIWLHGGNKQPHMRPWWKQFAVSRGKRASAFNEITRQRSEPEPLLGRITSARLTGFSFRYGNRFPFTAAPSWLSCC